MHLVPCRVVSLGVVAARSQRSSGACLGRRPAWHVEQIGISHPPGGQMQMRVPMRVPVPVPTAQHPNEGLSLPHACKPAIGHFPTGASGSKPSYPLWLALRLLLCSALSALPATSTQASQIDHCCCCSPAAVCGSLSRPHVPWCPHTQFCCAAPAREPRPRPSGIGKDPRPFTSNPRNPPSFSFPPSHTFKSWTRRLPPPIVPVLMCLPKSVWCFAL